MHATRTDTTPILAEAAMWAPSVHNTQPWRISVDHEEIRLLADSDRRLSTADPDGREMLISCGAALFNLRLAARHLGHTPEVRLLPDHQRPALIAEIRLGAPPAAGAEDDSRLYEQIPRRHTHRGAFRPGPLPASLLATVRDAAYRESAALGIVADEGARVTLGALTEAAEQLQRRTPGYAAETARWAPSPGSTRADGVHPSTYPNRSARTEPFYPGRDYARGQGWGARREDPDELITGTVAVLTTRGDDRADWLCAGQALQRVLLEATAKGVAAAFHTQPLELTEVRELIRTRLCDLAYPQMLLRLGPADVEPGSVRLPVEALSLGGLRP
jgi:nitroreductase